MMTNPGGCAFLLWDAALTAIGLTTIKARNGLDSGRT